MKYALVTGSSEGIGLEIGLKLISEGYHVIFNSRSLEKLNLNLSKTGVEKKQYSVIGYDNSDITNVDNFAIELLSITSQIDVIVFNSGQTNRSDMTNIMPEDLISVFGCNVFFPILLLSKIKFSLNNNSNIIFIGSILGKYPHSRSLTYGVSKASVNSLAKNLLKFYDGTNIRVNCINPGFVNTKWHDSKTSQLLKKINSKIYLHRFAEVREIANLVYHVIQNEYITGSIIDIDGGYSYM
jgi:3-oxoacyl-[acyl-carrier protein] reductase